MNIAEIELSVLARGCPARRIPDRPTLAQELRAWQRDRNQSAKASAGNSPPPTPGSSSSSSTHHLKHDTLLVQTWNEKDGRLIEPRLTPVGAGIEFGNGV